MDRAEKAASVASLQEVFKAAEVVVVCHYSGLTVAQMSKLRRQMQTAGASVKVAKNRLAKIALEGTDVASIGTLLKGPTLLAYSGDPVAAAKVASDFAKTNDKLVILGGAMGKTVLDPNAVKRLPRCRRWTSCGPRSWASSRLRRPRSRKSSLRPRPRSRACSGLTPPRAKLPELRTTPWFEPNKELYPWLIFQRSLTNSRA